VFSFTVVIAKHLPHPVALISSISTHPLPALMKTLPDLEHIPYDTTRGLTPSRFVFSFAVVVAGHPAPPIALIPSISTHPPPALMKTSPDLKYIPYNTTRGLTPSRFIFSFAVVVARHPPPPIAYIHSISMHPPPLLMKTLPDLEYIPYNMMRGLTLWNSDFLRREYYIVIVS
jgi:hypothetical protein